MSSEPKYRDEKWLREQYVERKLSTYDIANKCGCCKTTVRNWLNKFNIDTRPSSSCAERRAPDGRLTDAEWLQEQYIGENKSGHEVAEKCGCDSQTVYRWLRRHEIEVRGKAGVLEDRVSDERLLDAEWLREQHIEKNMLLSEIAEECGCSGDTIRYWMDKHGIEKQAVAWSLVPDDRLADAEWLQNQYVEKEHSLPKIADKCDCSASTVRSWLLRHGIETREWSGGLSGPEHPNWNGGKRAYGPGWHERKRREVRARDGHTCQDPRCSVTQSDHVEKYGESLHVHHLRKALDVDDPEERNAKENLITLCRDCHRRWEKMADAGLVPEVFVDA